MNIKKLKNCKNCFRIVSNHKYVIANGDSVTVYQRDDLSVQCTIPSKTFPHAYCVRFLSDDIVMMKNNSARYMVYNIAQERVLWEFKVRGYDSIDSDYLVSSDGKLVFDIVSPSDHKGPAMELIVSLQEKCYVLQPLQEPTACQDGWVRYPHIYTAKDATDGVYMACMFGPPKPDATQKERGVVLLHKSRFVGSDYKEIKRWENMEPIALGDRCMPNGIKYLDSEYMIFNDLQYWNLITKQYGSLPDIPSANPSFSLERKSDPVKKTSFFLLHELYNEKPVIFSPFSLIHSESVDMRQRIFLVAMPDGQLTEVFDHVDGTEDKEICGIEFLDTPNRFLIGTMSGTYLCER
jgi:hypothetical protein